jgi:hypothetical protein
MTAPEIRRDRRALTVYGRNSYRIPALYGVYLDDVRVGRISGSIVRFGERSEWQVFRVVRPGADTYIQYIRSFPPPIVRGRGRADVDAFTAVRSFALNFFSPKEPTRRNR